MMVALVAIVVIVVLGFFAFKMFPMNADSGAQINVDLPTGGDGANGQ